MQKNNELPAFNHHCFTNDEAEHAFGEARNMDLRQGALAIVACFAASFAAFAIFGSGQIQRLLHIDSLGAWKILVLIVAGLLWLGFLMGAFESAKATFRAWLTPMHKDGDFGSASAAELDDFLHAARLYPSIGRVAKDWAERGLTIRHRDVQAAFAYVRANKDLLAQISANRELRGQMPSL